MITKDELMQVREVLQYPGPSWPDARQKALAIIDKALANDALDRMAENARELGIQMQPEPEPVAWIDMAYARLGMVRDKMNLDDVATVQRFLEGDYTSPPKREWQGLTDEEREELMDTYDVASTDYAQAIEAKLKEKNT